MTNLNSILNRLLPEHKATTPVLDCVGCEKKWKCCDFQPFVANFLLGAILEENPNFELTGVHHWQPLGLIPSHEFRERHAYVAALDRDESLVCQFFDQKKRGCTIWKFRPGECSNYFCEDMTEELARGSLDSFAIEAAVSQRALFELGFEQDFVGAQVDLLNEPTPFEPRDEAELRKIYLESWQWARNLEAKDVVQWLK